MMGERSLVVSTGFEPSWKTAGQKNASSGSRHKKSPLNGGPISSTAASVEAVKIA